jgi:hypothetical protein
MESSRRNMDDTILIWLGIFMAIALAGEQDGVSKTVFRWVFLLLTGVLMIAFYN